MLASKIFVTAAAGLGGRGVRVAAGRGELGLLFFWLGRLVATAAG
jgi:hypothetical protein